MTSGERMVWATEYTRARGAGHGIVRSVESAASAVEELTHARGGLALDSRARELLEDMLGNGADR